MKSEKMLYTFGLISDDFIQEAAALVVPKEMINNKRQTFRRKTPVKKAVIGVAVVILLLGSFITAMAVSEEFREAVNSFLDIFTINLSTQEVVPPLENFPGISPTVPPDAAAVEIVKETTIEETVNVKYTTIRGYYNCRQWDFPML